MIVVESMSLVKAILGEVETAAIFRCRTRPDIKSPAQMEIINWCAEHPESLINVPTRSADRRIVFEVRAEAGVDVVDRSND